MSTRIRKDIPYSGWQTQGDKSQNIRNATQRTRPANYNEEIARKRKEISHLEWLEGKRLEAIGAAHALAKTIDWEELSKEVRAMDEGYYDELFKEQFTPDFREHFKVTNYSYPNSWAIAVKLPWYRNLWNWLCGRR